MNATVVVADDDELVAEIVSAVLDREGIRSVCAYDGSAAIAKVDEHNARALILDIHMPKKSGLEVLRVLKRGDREAPPKVLVLTAQAGRGMEELARANGADDFLAKPFDPYELARRVKRLLGREETS